MSNQGDGGTSRRDVLKGGAIGAGALASVMAISGIGSEAADAAVTVPHIAGAGVANYFLKLDGIAGESTAAQHRGEIEISSFSFGVSNAGSPAGGVGKATPSSFSFLKTMDKSSPKLMLACCTGMHIQSGLLSVSRPIGTAQSFLKIDLSDILVSSYENSGGGQVPSEAFSLNFLKIEISYWPESPKGVLGTPVTATFDFGTNIG